MERGTRETTALGQAQARKRLLLIGIALAAPGYAVPRNVSIRIEVLPRTVSPGMPKLFMRDKHFSYSLRELLADSSVAPHSGERGMRCKQCHFTIH